MVFPWFAALLTGIKWVFFLVLCRWMLTSGRQVSS